MKIEKLILKNFRSYKEPTEIEIDDLSVFVGKNDVGKSSVLEALDIFINEGKKIIKMEKSDVNVQGAEIGNADIEIGLVLGNLPEGLTIDATNETTLEEEHLLGRDGKLTIIKRYPAGGKETVLVRAHHPTRTECANLLLLKQSELRKMVPEGVECNKSKNAEMRKAIWRCYSDNLKLDDVEIELKKIDAKDSWQHIKKHLPVYALFQSDRKNSDGDSEVQDPMKVAVAEILKDEQLLSSLEGVADKVKDKLSGVVNQTIERLGRLNPDIGRNLKPDIPSNASLKWVDVFKSVTISGDDNIAVNKRGSGVKRLVLLSFFQATAERRKSEERSADIIYAIEEPETSQHPMHQQYLIEALEELSKTENTQIILTTHSPAIVKMLDFEHLRLITDSPEKVKKVEPSQLPYPSLNEVNFLAFGEVDAEYHNELYGYIESNRWLDEYKKGKEKTLYRQEQKNQVKEKSKIWTEYIRHQIHHPENKHNPRYTRQQLEDSIVSMREFIQDQRTA